MSRIFSALVSAVLLLGALVLPAQAQFADQSTYIATTGGSANAQTVTIPNVVSLSDILGVQLKIKPSFTNTTAMTLNPNGLGAIAVNKTSAAGPIALTGSEFVSSPNAQTVSVMYDGTRFLILSDVNSSPTSIFPSPQGYLTPCPAAGGVTGCTAGNIVPTGDVTSVGTLYYTPAFGNQVPIYNGSSIVTYQFSELTLTLGSSNLANTIYDVCITTTSAGAYNINGVPTIVTSVAWTTSTAGSGARGTGASTAQIARINGIETNAVQIDGKNGGTTYSAIPANRCTIVGTILVDGTNGQVTFHRTSGQNRKWGAWNFYNRQNITLQVVDPTASWTYNTNTIRASNGNTANSATVLSGLAEEIYTFQTTQRGTANSGNATTEGNSGVGFNATNAFSGKIGTVQASVVVGPTATTVTSDMQGTYIVLPQVGANVVTMLENCPQNGSATMTFSGQSKMLMSASWRG